MKALWIGSRSSREPNPSSVRMLRPAQPPTGMTHDRAARPSRTTVHAPHSPSPHPHLGPLSLRSLRNTRSKGVVQSAKISHALSFTCSNMVPLDLSADGLFGVVEWPVSRRDELVIRSSLHESLLDNKLRVLPVIAFLEPFFDEDGFRVGEQGRATADHHPVFCGVQIRQGDVREQLA